MSIGLTGGLKLAYKTLLVLSGGIYALSGSAFAAHCGRSDDCRKIEAALTGGTPVARKIDDPLFVCESGNDVTTGIHAEGYRNQSVRSNGLPATCDRTYTAEATAEQNGKWTRIPISGSITAGVNLLAAPWVAFSPAGSIHLRYSDAGNDQKIHFQTLLDASGTFAGSSQTDATDRDLNIFHAGVEEDEGLTTRVSLLQHAMIDRNSVQGLHLQKLYGGGCGITVAHREKTALEIPITIDYVDQQFSDSADATGSVVNSRQVFIGPSIGADIAYSGLPKFPLFGTVSVSPSWSLREMYAASVAAGAERKISGRFGISLELAYAYIDNSPATFSGSSLQMNIGVAYSFP